MKTFLIILITVIVTAPTFYLVGGYVTAKRLHRDMLYADLMWFTAIDTMFEAGMPEKARKVTQTAADSTLQALSFSQTAKMKGSLLVTVMGWIRMDEFRAKTALRAKHHFLRDEIQISEDSKKFLSGIPEASPSP